MGWRVVERLGAADVETRALSRGGHPDTVRGDLLIGEGTTYLGDALGTLRFLVLLPLVLLALGERRAGHT